MVLTFEFYLTYLNSTFTIKTYPTLHLTSSNIIVISSSWRTSILCRSTILLFSSELIFVVLSFFVFYLDLTPSNTSLTPRKRIVRWVNSEVHFREPWTRPVTSSDEILRHITPPLVDPWPDHQTLTQHLRPQPKCLRQRNPLNKLDTFNQRRRYFTNVITMIVVF